MRDETRKRVYLHGELPPMRGEVEAEHWIEARSDPVSLAEADHGKAWRRCYDNMQQHLFERLEQEIARMSGCCAQVYDEHVEQKYDYAQGQYWLEGKFDYLLYRDPNPDPAPDPAPDPDPDPEV